MARLYLPILAVLAVLGIGGLVVAGAVVRDSSGPDSTRAFQALDWTPAPTLTPAAGSPSAGGPTPAAGELDAASFGAVGDGSTDDTQALQAALQAAVERGSTLLLRPGVYVCSDGLTLPDGASIMGAGRSSWINATVTVGSAVACSDVRIGRDGAPSIVVPTGTHDLVFDSCTFTGGQPLDGAVVTLTNPCHDITFRTCTIGPGLVNGVTIVDKGNTIHDITFEGCTFKPSARMGFECISRGSETAVYQRINLVDCVFEPQGSQAISYDGPPLPANCLIDNVVIKGAGTNPAYPWGAGLELNGPGNFTVTNSRIWQTRGSAFNLQRKVSAPCGWVITGNVLDATHRVQTTPQSSSAQQVLAFSVHGGVFSNNTIISASSGGGVAYMSDSHDMDWRGSTWKDADGRHGYATPIQVDGSSGNLF